MPEGRSCSRGRVEGAVVCHVCEKTPQARSLRSLLKSTHDIYQQVVVADDLLEEHASTRYPLRGRVGGAQGADQLKCPFPGCPGKLSSEYMLRRHFRDLHPKDSVEVPWEGSYPQCEQCVMQCYPKYPQHIHLQVCQLGLEQRTQRDSAITSAFALRQLFYIKREVLENSEGQE